MEHSHQKEMELETNKMEIESAPSSVFWTHEIPLESGKVKSL